jgi:hypothetical protein
MGVGDPTSVGAGLADGCVGAVEQAADKMPTTIVHSSCLERMGFTSCA